VRKFNGSVALVAGASSGWRSHRVRLARAGYKVYGLSRCGSKMRQRAFEMVPPRRDERRLCRCPVTELLSRDGRIDLFLNNAGLGVAPAPLS